MPNLWETNFPQQWKPYFEACNILPTNAIPDRYKHSISEGWNSLCPCPNCAAEFKYGKKNLSELISMIQDAVRPFIENIDTVNELCNKPVKLLVDKDNLYIATTA